MKKAYLTPLVCLALASCGGTPSSIPSSSGSETENTFDMTVSDMSEYRESALSLGQGATKISWSASQNEIYHRGTTTYGETSTLLSGVTSVATGEVDEDFNPIYEDSGEIAFASIEDGYFYYVNSKEHEPNLATAYAYSIGETGDISEEQAQSLLREDGAFLYDVEWFWNLADDSYIENYQGLTIKGEKNGDITSVKASSSYSGGSSAYTYESSYEFSSEGALLKGDFTNIQYEKNAEGALTQSMVYSYSIEVSYEKETISFDKSPYFASAIEEVDIHSTSSKSNNVAILNEPLLLDIKKASPETAIDQDSYSILSSDNEEVIALVDGDYLTVGTGKANITIGNSYNDVTFTQEVTVVRPDLIGFDANASNGEKSIEKKVGETDYVAVVFSPEGAEPAAEIKIDDESVIEYTGQRVEKVNGIETLFFDLAMVGEGTATARINPMAAPSTYITITFTVGA